MNEGSVTQGRLKDIMKIMKSSQAKKEIFAIRYQIVTKHIFQITKVFAALVIS